MIARILKYAPAIIGAALLGLAVALTVHAHGLRTEADRRDLEAAETAFVIALAAIHRVPALDRDAALAGGRSACYWIDRYGLDRTTLAGWETYWHQPWEGRWLRLSVDLLCPLDG